MDNKISFELHGDKAARVQISVLILFFLALILGFGFCCYQMGKIQGQIETTDRMVANVSELIKLIDK